LGKVSGEYYSFFLPIIPPTLHVYLLMLMRCAPCMTSKYNAIQPWPSVKSSPLTWNLAILKSSNYSILKTIQVNGGGKDALIIIIKNPDNPRYWWMQIFGNDCMAFSLFSYLRNHETCRMSVWNIKCVPFSTQILFKRFFTLISI
jgi:hypothetical protein